jgi:hypothetical protein
MIGRKGSQAAAGNSGSRLWRADCSLLPNGRERPMLFWPEISGRRRYFFLSGGGSTQFVYFVVRVHLPIFGPLVSQPKTTHLSQM